MDCEELGGHARYDPKGRSGRGADVEKQGEETGLSHSTASSAMSVPWETTESMRFGGELASASKYVPLNAINAPTVAPPDTVVYFIPSIIGALDQVGEGSDWCKA